MTEQGKEKLKKSGGHLVIPEGITEIDSQVFCYYKKVPNIQITSVTFPSTLKKIDLGAFTGNAISGEVIIPEGVDTIEHAAFRDNKISKLVLPKSLKVLELESFGRNQITDIEADCDLTKVKTKNDGGSGITDDPQTNSPLAAQTLPDIVLVPDSKQVDKIQEKIVNRPFMRMTGSSQNQADHVEVFKGDNGASFPVDNMGTSGKNKGEFIFNKGTQGKIGSLLLVNGYKIQNVNGDTDPQYGNMLGYGTFNLKIAGKHNVTYAFQPTKESSTPLPQAVMQLLPAKSQAYETTTVKAPALAQTEYSEANGKWQFKGWDKTEQVVGTTDVTFTGTWAFIPTPTPTPTPTPMLKQARHPKSFGGTYLPETGVVGNSIWSLLTILGLVGTFMLYGEKKK